MEKHNKFKIWLFIIFLVLLIVGGFVLMKLSENMFNDNKIAETQEEEQKVDIRKDITKEYIYFEDSEPLVEELDIEYKKIVLNFEDSNNIATTLNEETLKEKEKVQYDETQEEEAYNKLSYAKYKKYNIYLFDNYISLVVDYFEYTPEELVTYKDTKTYVFDKKSGSLYSNEELINKYKLTEEEIKDNIKTHLEDINLMNEEENIDIDSTLENINEYSLYIDKMGKLSLSILVKSDIKDYNDIVVLN